MGFEAVPSPTKNRRSAPGYQPLTEDAAGPDTERADAVPLTGAEDAEAETVDDDAFEDETTLSTAVLPAAADEVLERWELPLPGEEPFPSRALRAAAREPRDGADDVAGPAEADGAWELEPVESEDLPVSANAAGIAATAEPTPSATASAPTWPT
ncbi:hypothetical protein MHEL_39820 [Mycolicibacterium helvum]|uniref:Uncharacterized protein n=1 Tax=Mycolicibacterium helvum TaxID=1534349 RepID=A0A7I7TBB3_9MYCO|nr:hypothetical protein MHEL_39820 [Mycolicibacterium helvum]